MHFLVRGPSVTRKITKQQAGEINYSYSSTPGGVFFSSLLWPSFFSEEPEDTSLWHFAHAFHFFSVNGSWSCDACASEQI